MCALVISLRGHDSGSDGHRTSKQGIWIAKRYIEEALSGYFSIPAVDRIRVRSSEGSNYIHLNSQICTSPDEGISDRNHVRSPNPHRPSKWLGSSKKLTISKPTIFLSRLTRPGMARQPVVLHRSQVTPTMILRSLYIIIGSLGSVTSVG